MSLIINGIDRETKILKSFIDHNHDKMILTEIADHIEEKANTISYAINKLIDKGMIDKIGRYYYIHNFFTMENLGKIQKSLSSTIDTLVDLFEFNENLKDDEIEEYLTDILIHAIKLIKKS